MPTISVIVPVYNTEKYLHRCVDSILAQTFTDFELLLVDDGSTDKSGTICDEYAERDGRIRVIHKKNGGAAAARNDGIRDAQGEYLAFCDSDDVVSPQWIERLYVLAEEGSLPIGAWCGTREPLGTVRKLDITQEKKYSRREYYAFNTAGIAGYLWNALYRKDIVLRNDIQLREQHEKGDYNEDLLFALTYVQYVDTLIYTGYADYLYDIRNESLSRGNRVLYYEKYAEKFRLWSEFIQRERNDIESEMKKLATTTLFHFLTALHQCDNRSEIKRIVMSKEMRDCLCLADTSMENPLEIRLIRGMNISALYVFYRLIRWKGKRNP